jgi:hypothetical protein
MGRTKIKVSKLNMKGFEAIRTAPKVMDMLDEIAQDMADRAGEGYKAVPASATGGRVRGRAMVVTDTFEAKVDQAKNRTLERVVGSTRG